MTSSLSQLLLWRSKFSGVALLSLICALCFPACIDSALIAENQLLDQLRASGTYEIFIDKKCDACVRGAFAARDFRGASCVYRYGSPCFMRCHVHSRLSLMNPVHCNAAHSAEGATVARVVLGPSTAVELGSADSWETPWALVRAALNDMRSRASHLFVALRASWPASSHITLFAPPRVPPGEAHLR